MTDILCKECSILLPEESFGEYKARSGNRVRRKNCNKCRSKRQQARYAKSPETQERMKRTARNRTLKTQYGITEDDVDRMILEQENCCCICTLEFQKTPNVDHCHDTGKVRGLLCWNCNIGLGYFKDSLGNLQRGYDYLQEHLDD